MAKLISSATKISVTAAPVGVPQYIQAISPGAAVQLATRISDAFAPFAGETGDPLGVSFYSGGAYDTLRARYLRSGGGHNDHNGNGVYAVEIYASESPQWTLLKPHTSPPSVTSFNDPSVETAPNGDPASSHTYNQIVYDATNDRLTIMGMGSAAGSTGNAFPTIRTLSLAANQWDPFASRPKLPNLPQSSPACFDPFSNVIWCKLAFGTPLQRYDVVSNTLTSVDDGLPTFNIDAAIALDPARRYLIAIGGYSDIGPLDNGSADMVLWDLASFNGSGITAYARSLGGMPAALRSAKVALEFHPPSGSFVAWSGSDVLYRLIPPANPFTGAWTFQTITPAGTGLPVTSNGVYSKFRWAPYPSDKKQGVFVMDSLEGSSGNYSASKLTLYKPNF
jgi:hypothetical protein